MIDEIKIYDFRCIKNLHLKFEKINLIYGKNAKGKTSIIEAIYFLATGKSFRTKKNKELIRYDKNKAIVFAKNDNEKFAVELVEDKKNFLYNSEKIKYIDYIGKIFAISFIPEDIELIISKPSVRRAFFNYEISQLNKKYLNLIVDYEKILKIRNRYLKEKKYDENLKKIYEEKYIDLNFEIILARKKYIDKLSEIINKKYKELFNKSDELKIEYKTIVDISDISKIKENLKKIIEQKKEKEEIYGYSLYGIHKDEFEIKLNNRLAKSFSSQGEKKSIIFTIKISEIEINNIMNKKNTIFLMDDINSYFDENRRKNIMKYLKNNDIQCFITSTDNQNIEGKEFYIEKIND